MYEKLADGCLAAHAVILHSLLMRHQRGQNIRDGFPSLSSDWCGVHLATASSKASLENVEPNLTQRDFVFILSPRRVCRSDGRHGPPVQQVRERVKQLQWRTSTGRGSHGLAFSSHTVLQSSSCPVISFRRQTWLKIFWISWALWFFMRAVVCV